MDAQTSSADATTIRLAEYQALRAEILKRFDIQHQLLSLAIIAAGTMFIASVEAPDHTVGAVLILGYPVLSLFLAAGWGHHDRRIRQAGVYIRDSIEKSVGPDLLGWERYHYASRVGPGLQFLSSRGIFVGSELFAILVGAALARLDLLVQAAVNGTPLTADALAVVALLIVALVSVPLTMLVLRRAS